MDAILFLAMVSVCALILSAAASGDERQRAVSDASLRSLASSTLASVETVRADYFEYRILGDMADSTAVQCGIDPGAWLYRDTANAVLGRGNRHKTVMEIAAEDAACQLTLRYENQTLKLSPLTGDYDDKARDLVDGTLRIQLDQRYAYHFSLRWVPFAEVPFEGALSCGGSDPPGAATASAYVTMPYRTNVTRGLIEAATVIDMDAIEKATAEYRSGGPTESFRGKVRTSLDGCLENASRPMVKEALGNTVYEVIPAGDTGNPLSVLAAFSGDGIAGAGPLSANKSLDVEDALCRMIVQYNSASLDKLSDGIVRGVGEGTMDTESERDYILGWMQSRYEPSRARATLSVWVDADD